MQTSYHAPDHLLASPAAPNPGRTQQSPGAFRSAPELRDAYASTLEKILGILRHPRSLARAQPRWRPPRARLPMPGPARHGELIVTITRHRVGARAAARIQGYSGTQPAYLVTLRFAGTRRAVEPALAEAWVRALLPEDQADAAHELVGLPAPTYCWFVDHHFNPVRSPAAIFSRGGLTPRIEAFARFLVGIVVEGIARVIVAVRAEQVEDFVVLVLSIERKELLLPALGVVCGQGQDVEKLVKVAKRAEREHLLRSCRRLVSQMGKEVLPILLGQHRGNLVRALP